MSTHVVLVPLQWSAASSSQAPPWEAPVQLVVLDLKPSAGHAPEVPVHISATSHWPAEARQVVVAGSNTSTHVLLVPLQWSAASSSQAPPWEAPVQLVVLNLKLSAGHAPEVPVHI